MTRSAPLFAAPRAALEIRRARLRRALAGDRERLAHQLDSVRSADIGLGPRSILFIPRVVVDRPLSRHGQSRFAGSVVDALRTALRQARRPGDPHSNDDPLLFDDEADAAAAIISAWLAGAASADRHRWSGITGGLEPTIWWRRHLLSDPVRLPCVVERLAQRRLAAAWIARLDPQDLETALATVASAHGLELPPAFSINPVRRHQPAAEPSVARAIAIVPECLQPGLNPRARLLLLVALLARRRPSLLSTPIVHRASEQIVELGSPAPRKTGSADPANANVARAAPPIRPETRGQTGADTEPVLRRAPVRPSPMTPSETDREPIVKSLDDSISPNPLATQFGGMLFILNALLALGLYGDFSRPDRRLPCLSPFVLLALLGRRWFGREFRADPIYRWLIDLAGESEGEPAQEFAPPAWSAPNSWLDPWPRAGALRIGNERPHPFLWHPAGFPLLQLPRYKMGAAMIAAHRAGFRRIEYSDRLPGLPRTARAQWIACLALYLDARLARAIDDRGGRTLLCRQPARIAADGERVTARFALAHHPVAIRLAGLDRDPGWLPAAGRIVEFAFE